MQTTKFRWEAEGLCRGRWVSPFSVLVDHSCLPIQIEHLYGLTVFENYLYATNSDNANAQQKTSVIRVNRFNSTDYQVVTRVDKGGALHIYHQRRQPQGERGPTVPPEPSCSLTL